MNKHAFLILTHKPIEHIYKFAKYYKDCNFYIHVDKKSDMIKKAISPKLI